MHTECELKARLNVPIEETRRRLTKAGWELVLEGEMSDRLLDTPDGRLFSIDEVLRVRRISGAGGAVRTILTWKGPTRYENGLKVRDELETVSEDATVMLALFERLGFSTVAMAIDRRITIYETDSVHVRIEQYPDMDTLIEIEGEPDAIERRIDDVGLPRSSWVPWRLQEFVDRYEARTGRVARLASEESGVRG
jgi:predicted adenylyl cyclase CyaB